MLTALFNLVWNTQKSKWTICFENHDKHPSKYWLDRESIQLFGADLCERPVSDSRNQEDALWTLIIFFI